MNKREVLARINEIVLDEKGDAVTMDNVFTDTNLDSLGTVLSLILIDSEFHIFKHDEVGEDLADLDLQNLTIRDLVVKCVLSISNTSTVPKTEMAT